MYDRFRRNINYLRVSVTDRCNLRCTYCMPAEGVQLMSHKDILRFNEITAPPVNHAEEDGAANAVPHPRDPEIMVGDVESPDLVIPEAVVLRQNDFDIVAANLEFSAQTEDDIGEPSYLGDWGKF